MKNFIIPIDFSRESIHGLEMAVLFSSKMKIDIQLVYVITSVSDYRPSTISEEHKFAEERFAILINEYAPLLKNDSTISYIIKQGKVYREIVNQANAYKDSIVSASTHGASGFEELFAGSNALKIMAATSKPVLTIRTGPAPRQINKIVMPIKLHPDTRQKVPVTAQIAKLFNAEVHVVSISTSKNKRDLDRLKSYSKQAESFLNGQDIKVVSKSVTGESLPILTINYAEAVDADLIIMMSSAIDKWNVFLGSYAQQMLNRSKYPLLCIKPRTKDIATGFRTQG